MFALVSRAVEKDGELTLTLGQERMPSSEKDETLVLKDLPLDCHSGGLEQALVSMSILLSSF
jgi:hypothetical protein